MGVSLGRSYRLVSLGGYVGSLPDSDARRIFPATSSRVCHRASERAVRSVTRRLDCRSSMGIQGRGVLSAEEEKSSLEAEG